MARNEFFNVLEISIDGFRKGRDLTARPHVDGDCDGTTALPLA